ncbi:CvpA family protein [Nitratifractor sp.]|uniref:CvpA family protein n=1 Tax=Nitratifractor sp. TaxID=2268144 RepID=UPI0025E5AB8F|nr:CvpA family protein [Nitratifractor sp.]
MTFNSFDLIVAALVLLLGLKGIVTGFLRELFGLVGLVGGVFLASRGADPLARLIETKLFHLPNPALGRLIAFVLILALIWGGCSWLGRRIQERRAEQRPGTAERIGGFLVAALKYFLIFAMILSALYRTPAIHDKLRHRVQGSALFPLLMRSGKFLIHSAPSTGQTSTKKHGR